MIVDGLAMMFGIDNSMLNKILHIFQYELVTTPPDHYDWNLITFELEWVTTPFFCILTDWALLIHFLQSA